MIRWIQISASVWSSYAPWIIGQNSIFLLLTFGILFLLRKHSANLKYWIGVLALFKCLLPPFLPAPFLNGNAVAETSIQIVPVQPVSFFVDRITFSDLAADRGDPLFYALVQHDETLPEITGRRNKSI
jgi:hypothetical protein